MADLMFNPKAVKAISSPDDLEKTVRVTSPGVWLLLAACVALLMGLLVWGICGTVNNVVSDTGVYSDGKVICFLTASQVEKIREVKTADVEGCEATITETGSLPLSKDEAAKMVGSKYLAEEMMDEEWEYPVTMTINDTEGFRNRMTVPVRIITERISPISVLFNGI